MVVARRARADACAFGTAVGCTRERQQWLRRHRHAAWALCAAILSIAEYVAAAPGVAGPRAVSRQLPSSLSSGADRASQARRCVLLSAGVAPPQQQRASGTRALACRRIADAALALVALSPSCCIPFCSRPSLVLPVCRCALSPLSVALDLTLARPAGKALREFRRPPLLTSWGGFHVCACELRCHLCCMWAVASL
jgi:hypothetical protein